MQTSDLRTGNLVLIKGTIVEIESIGSHWVNVELFDFGYGCYVRNKVDIGEVRPVRLSEAWLKKFGWREITPGEWFLTGFDYFQLSKATGRGDYFCAIQPVEKGFFVRKPQVMFVHQLQNMYHVDMEKEMKIENAITSLESW